jgi:hypothetical protein
VHRWVTAASWPVGLLATSWDYMWRTTPLHRRELLEHSAATHLPPPLPPGVSHEEIQGPESGRGPLFHRRYATSIRQGRTSARELLGILAENPNRAAPTAFARFLKVTGRDGELEPGDEYVVRMPGPWDGPVRVLDRGPTSFRLATLAGHLEAGQIEFRAVQQPREPMLRFEIESWARSADWLSNLLYHRLRMAKEIQFHMWISFLERVVGLSGGRMTGGIEVVTHRVHAASQPPGVSAGR